MSFPTYRVIRVERSGTESFELREVSLASDGRMAVSGRPLLASSTLEELRDLIESLADAVSRPTLERSGLPTPAPDDEIWQVVAQEGWWCVLNTRTGRRRRVGRVGCGRFGYRMRAAEIAEDRNAAIRLKHVGKSQPTEPRSHAHAHLSA